MKNQIMLALASVTWMLFYSVDAAEYNVISTTSSTLSGNSTEAGYTCTFRNLWEASRHPEGFPTANAHWSPMVLAAHADSYTMWAPATKASGGVEVVAETGGTGTLEEEIEAADTTEASLGSAQFHSNKQSQVLPTVKVDPTHYLLSSITMIAPSPDWFSGFYNFDPRDEGNNWYDSFSIETYPWDAGTEQGDTYSINNDPEDPIQDIFQLTNDTIPETRVFQSPDGTEVLPVAQWDCQISTECFESCRGGRGKVLYKERFFGRFCVDRCIPQRLVRIAKAFGWACGRCEE